MSCDTAGQTISIWTTGQLCRLTPCWVFYMYINIYTYTSFFCFFFLTGWGSFFVIKIKIKIKNLRRKNIDCLCEMKILAHGLLLETGLSSVTPWTASTMTFSTLVLSVDTSTHPSNRKLWMMCTISTLWSTICHSVFYSSQPLLKGYGAAISETLTWEGGGGAWDALKWFFFLSIFMSKLQQKHFMK